MMVQIRYILVLSLPENFGNIRDQNETFPQGFWDYYPCLKSIRRVLINYGYSVQPNKDELTRSQRVRKMRVLQSYTP